MANSARRTIAFFDAKADANNTLQGTWAGFTGKDVLRKGVCRRVL
jgi:hypothetical protein